VSIWTFLAAGYYLAISVPLVGWDFKEHRLPNRYTISALIFCATLVALDALSYQRLQPLISGVAAAGITWGAGYLMAKFDLIGMGDIKLLTGQHLWLAYFNPWLVLLSLTSGFVFASAFSALQLIRGRLNLKSNMALGPFLLAGFLLAAVAALTGEV
jgi:leader peptidase (prepilin peptidase)/N-methyltransferase